MISDFKTHQQTKSQSIVMISPYLCYSNMPGLRFALIHLDIDKSQYSFKEAWNAFCFLVSCMIFWINTCYKFELHIQQQFFAVIIFLAEIYPIFPSLFGKITSPQ